MGGVYTPPGGKVDAGETPTECIVREFKEETGLELINPELKFIACYKDKSEEGYIFFYVAKDYVGKLNESNDEGTLSWVNVEDSYKLKQFPMNEILYDYIFKEGRYEIKIIFDEKGFSKIKEYSITKI